YTNLCADEGGHFVLMGDPKTPLRIAYPNTLKLIETIGGDKKVLAEQVLAELHPPSRMTTYTDHGGVIVIDSSADIEKAVNGTVDSYKFPRSCKSPVAVLLDETRNEEYLQGLTCALEKLKVGDVTNPETDIAKLSDDTWYCLVDPFIRSGKGGGRLRYPSTGSERNQPIVLEGYFEDNFEMEPHWITICVENVQGIDGAIEKINRFGKNSSRYKFLDLAVFHNNPDSMDKLYYLRAKGQFAVHAIHENQSTMSVNPYVGHEDVILRDIFAGSAFLDQGVPYESEAPKSSTFESYSSKPF
ncbi:MAG: hypothetical protein ACP5E4_04100, partial [Candidatus Aenigmatarchaeota archaeon]